MILDPEKFNSQNIQNLLHRSREVNEGLAMPMESFDKLAEMREKVLEAGGAEKPLPSS